jgi:hypothetical protein
VSDRLARQWIAEHGEDYVSEKAAPCQPDCGGRRYRARYLSAAIRDDYRPEEAQPSPAAVVALAERRAAQSVAEQEAEAAREAEVSTARRERARKLARVREVAEARNPTQRDSDRRLFLSQLEDETGPRGIRPPRLGLGHQRAGDLCAFWEDMVPGIFEAPE